MSAPVNLFHPPQMASVVASWSFCHLSTKLTVLRQLAFVLVGKVYAQSVGGLFSWATNQLERHVSSLALPVAVAAASCSYPILSQQTLI